MKNILSFLIFFMFGLAAYAQSSLKIGITNNIGITQQHYGQWMAYSTPILENGANYSTGLLLEKEVGKLLFRTGLSYQYTTFKDLDNQLPLYGFNLPSGVGFLSDPTLEQQSFHKINIPIAVGYQLVNRKKLKISGLAKISTTTTFSRQDTYSGYRVYSLFSSFLEKGTATYSKNKLRLKGINFQTGITVQHQIAKKYTLFWQPMISILEYRLKNDISETTAQENFFLSDNQFTSLKNFGLGFGILRTL